MKRVLSLLSAILLLSAALCACGAKDAPLALDNTELNLMVGDSASLSAGSAAKVHWESSDEAIASVSGGTVNAKAPGDAVITVSLENGETATCAVTVTEKHITAITLSAANARLEEGGTIQLTAIYKPADASDKKLSWSSSDEDVAKVDEQGYVTGIGDGTATVVCESANGVRASCHITVGGLPELATAAPTQPATEKPKKSSSSSKTKTSSQKSSDNDDDDDDDDTAPSSGYTDGYVFPDSSERYLTESEVAARLDAMSGSPVSSSFAQDAVNEIYARHGYVFRSASIRKFYESRSWYRVDPSYDGSVSEIEQHNIRLFYQYNA